MKESRKKNLIMKEMKIYLINYEKIKLIYLTIY